MGKDTWTWIRTGDRLALSNDDNLLHPEAIEIWAAEYERTGVAGGHAVSAPSIDIPEIVIATGFVDLGVELVSHPEEDPYLILVAKVESGTIQLDRWPDNDQLICRETWYPVDLEKLDGLRAVLTDHGIELHSALDEARAMWLLWSSGLEIKTSISTDNAVAVVPLERPELDGKTVTATLYPYQAIGAQKLTSMADQGLGCLLADEMGLGKTLQAIFLMSSEQRHDNGPCLVVAPSSTLANWQRELDRFASHLSVLLHSGPTRTGDPAVIRSFDVVIVSFETLNRDFYLMESVGWNLVVADEAQSIKNPSTRRANALKALPRRVSLAVTGTPIENSLTDMWSILEYVSPTYLRSLDEFRRLYPDDNEAALELSHRVAPLVIRRRVSDVAGDLPPRIDVPQPIYTGQRLAHEYESLRQTYAHDPLTAMTKLRQLCASYRTFDTSLLPLHKDFPKFDRALEIVDEAFGSGSKVLIFASFSATLDELASTFSLYFPTALVLVLDGRTPISERQPLLDQFSDFEGPAALIMNPKAGGVGLNIQAASYVIHFTPEWNPATVAQASARAHRRGQTLPVFIYYLYYVATVEEKMMDRLEVKRDLQNYGLHGTETRAGDIEAALLLTPVGQYS